jgi:tRNA(Ile)-lysidine synthase
VPFHRTDKGKIAWPKGISSEDRRFCRGIYSKIESFYRYVFNYRKHIGYQPYEADFAIGCSAGLDSTALAHIHVNTRTLLMGASVKDDSLIYINHNLRSKEEIAEDVHHVEQLASQLGCECCAVGVYLEPGNVQAQASAARYKALANSAQTRTVLLAHHANDVAETKLWQFLTGREPNGMNAFLTRHGVMYARPLLSFTREELERYVCVWNLTWKEDSTNCTSKYARNRIRQELIPWIKKELNPGIVKMLAK